MICIQISLSIELRRTTKSRYRESFCRDITHPLADEPTGNLDHKNAIAIMDLMMSLQQESGTTIVIITHDKMVAGYAERVFELVEGELVLSIT